MKKRKSILLCLCVFLAALFFAACAKQSDITGIFIEEGYQSVVYMEDFDLSDYRLKVSYRNGTSEYITIEEDMVREGDLFKFYIEGEHEVMFLYDNYYCTADFTVLKNHFSDQLCLPDQTVAYDGEPHGLTVEGVFPEGTVITYPNGNAFVESSPNPYRIVAILTREGFEPLRLEGDLTVTPADYPREKLDAIVFGKTEYTYDGQPHKAEAENIPADLGYRYLMGHKEGNTATDAGEYPITLELTSSNRNYNPIPPITGSLIIKRAKYDKQMQRIVFDPVTAVYDGQPHKAVIQNPEALPSGVTVEYKYGDVTNAGTTKAVAIFHAASPNYEPIPDMETTVTVTPAVIDLGGISYGVQKYDYVEVPDGADKTVYGYEISGEIPEQVTPKITYTLPGGEPTETPVRAGIYTVSIRYELNPADENNYNIINLPEETPMMVVVRPLSEELAQKVSEIKEAFKDLEIPYDGEEHLIVIPDFESKYAADFTVTYTYYIKNEQTDSAVGAGRYEVRAHLAAKEYSYEEDINAMLTINAPTITE